MPIGIINKVLIKNFIHIIRLYKTLIIYHRLPKRCYQQQ